MKFEYRYEEYANFKLMVEKADELRKDGWELINIEHEVHGYCVGIFKRTNA